MAHRLPVAILALVAILSPAAAQHQPLQQKAGPTIPKQATNPIEQAARAAVASTMKDPQSAQFQNVRARRVPNKRGALFDVVCGDVNGKNSYGGFVGFSPFIYMADMKMARTLGPDRDILTVELLKDYCN